MPEAIAAWREAIAIYRRLPDQRADLAESCLDLGSLLAARADVTEATQLLQEAAELFADLRATEPKFGKQQSDALALPRLFHRGTGAYAERRRADRRIEA